MEPETSPQPMTRRLAIDSTQPQAAPLAAAAAVLQAGGLVAFPTETVYGLGADALNAAAVQRIFAAKQRPASDPLIVHLAARHDLPRVTATLPPRVAARVAQLWQAGLLPGPLTLVLPRGDAVPHAVTAGGATVAVRFPRHPVAHALLVAAGTPIAAPSANRFAHTSPTTAAHVLHDLDGRIDMVLDGGATPIGIESTVLDVLADPPRVLRPGEVTPARLQAVLGTVAVPAARSVPAAPSDNAPTAVLRAPGMLLKHYAPQHELRVVVGATAAVRAWLAQQASVAQQAGKAVGALLPDADAAWLAQHAPFVRTEQLGADLPTMAQRLYAALRALDDALDSAPGTRDSAPGTRDADTSVLLLARAPAPPQHATGDDADGFALALHDRLWKAASGAVWYV